ncbi:MAG: HAMP domain-containing protein [Flavobacteriales bacterium]|nr:HAMP domain-containing protein [Flavobacteriales bacterium]
MKTKGRLTVLLGVMLLLVTVLAAVSLATIWKLRGEGMAVIKANYNSIAYMQAMVEALDTSHDTAERHARLTEQIRAQQQNMTEPGEREATERLARALDSLASIPTDPAAVAGLRRAIAHVSDLNRAAIVDKAEAQERRGEEAVIWISFTATFAFLIAFSLFLSMPTFIAEPIRTLTDGIDRIAAGHYDERVTLQRSDEFGHMAERFNTMAAELERWSTSNLSRIMQEKTRAEAVINSLRYPSIGVDDQQRILFMNSQAAELLGVAPQDLMNLDATTAANRNDLLALILRAEGSATFKAVLNGREQHFTVESSPIETDAGRAGTVYTLYNVTPYLERDQAKTMFLATISHELKTPLASSDIGLGLLERHQAAQLTADQAEIVSDLRKDHQRLVRIVSELLDMAQLETGQLRVQVAKHSLPGIIHAAMDSVRAASTARGMQLAVHLHTPLPFVAADADKATWSLINLLSNALRHGPANSTITIRSEATGPNILVTVADDGPGLTMEQQAHLFERFAPHGAAGTGLGLSIARELMRAMGGDITYQAGPRGGAEFVLRFASPAND